MTNPAVWSSVLRRWLVFCKEITMSEGVYRANGRYFEEYSIGDTIVTVGRTITETDVVQFAGLTGDYNQIHTNRAYASQQLFGQRVAHGLLVLAISVGLATRTGIIEGTVLAFRELDWKFSRPVLINDTIHAQLEVIDIKPLPRLGGGNIILKANVYNQDNEVVQRGHWQMLVQSKPEV
jgi:3-hydroxybutyryl-CoA dehydratase